MLVAGPLCLKCNFGKGVKRAGKSVMREDENVIIWIIWIKIFISPLFFN